MFNAQTRAFPCACRRRGVARQCSMNRLRRLLIIGILTFILVSACRGNAPQQINSQTNSTSAEAVRVVEHALGKTKVPINPQRVVVLGGGLDTLLSLGVKPVGSVRFLPDNYYLKNRLEGIESVGDPDRPDLESIVALKPDLILGADFDDQSNYELLSQIAPTVIAELENTYNWRKMLSQYAEALGKTEKAKQIIADYNTRIKEFQAQMGNRLQETEVSIVRVRQDRIEIYLEDSFCGAVVADAGLSRPLDQTNVENPFSITISKELLQIADADAIFVWTFGHSEEIAKEAQSKLKQLKADPLWSQLSAVEQGKVYEVPSYWINMGPIAANLVLDDLFEYLVPLRESSR